MNVSHDRFRWLGLVAALVLVGSAPLARAQTGKLDIVDVEGQPLAANATHQRLNKRSWV